MLSFILNYETIVTDLPPGTTVLDFVRYHKHLTGTKIGCREGDCGACTVLVGTLDKDTVAYRSMTSCLMPLANARGKHLVTVEGINPNKAEATTPVQSALMEENGTQCGFCTVGFVMSMTGLCLEKNDLTQEKALSAIDGNICRCTGYKSIERAVARLTSLLKERKEQTPLSFAIENGIVPAYFSMVKKWLLEIQQPPFLPAPPPGGQAGRQSIKLGGGTDLYVQRPEEIMLAETQNLFDNLSLHGIQEVDGYIEIGGSVTVTKIMESPIMRDLFPNLQKHLKLVSSTPIRNMATVAGNLVNASPIGDLTVFFLALNASVLLQNGASREMLLRDFYIGYKSLAKTESEVLTAIRFLKPASDFRFNFEKVSKRTYLDIASVNSAIALRIEDDVIIEAHLSAGGVAPIPLYLKKTAAFLGGKAFPIKDELLLEANEILQSEISPISDVRGSAEYKRLLLSKLLYAHFMESA